MPLDKIDTDSKKNEISKDELEKALDNGFFDDENNVRALTQQVKNEESRLLESFRATLTQAYAAIRTKKTITQDDQKIIDLYRKLSPALSRPTPNLYAQAPLSKPGSESKEPNLNNITYNFDTTCRELTHWAKNTYPKAYNAMIKNMEKKHKNKTAGEKQDYIRYESIVRALETYYKKLDADNSTLLKKHGFYSTGTITDAQGKKETVQTFGGPDFFACGELFAYVSTIRYPAYEKDEKLLGSYNGGVEKILKHSGYRGNDKLSEHAKLYKNFEKEAKKNAEKNTYADSLTYLQQHDAPPSDREEDVKIYLDHMQSVFLYTQDYEKLTNKYGPKMLEGYATTMNSLSALDKKHSGFTDAISRMSAYNKKIEDKKKLLGGISNDTISNYINYTHEAQYLFKKQQALGDVSKRLTDEIQGKTKNASMFPEIKKRLSQEKQKQKRTDMIRDTIKKISPQSYLTLSLLTGAWNGLVDATIGVGTGLGLLVTSLYSDQFATMANAERAQAWTEFLKIGASSKQLEPLVKDGKANVSVDNVSVVLGSGVVNMLVLLTGAGMIGKGISSAGVRVGVNIAEKMARRGGLFTRATMQGLPSSFQTYLGTGLLDKKTAWSYALNSTLLSSTVEMFAPNDMFFGNPGVTSVIRSLGAKEAAKTLGKEFFKNISKEVGEEIGQETVQMVIEKRIHNHINDKHGTALDSSLTWADFWTTAMVTAMITGVVSGDGSYKMAKNTINKPATVQRICSDQNRYAEYTRKLQQIIDGTNKIPGVDYAFATQLLATLESVKQASVDAGPKEDAQQTVEKKEGNTEPDKITIKALNRFSLSLLDQDVVARARAYAMTDYEIQAIVMYGGPYFVEINAYLRTGELSNVGKLTEQQIKGITKLLESGLAKLPSISHAEIYRGEAITKEVFGSLKNKSGTGETYSFGGITSVTNNKEAARDRYSNWFNDENKQRVVFVIRPGVPSNIKSLESLDPTYILGDIGENIIGRDAQFFVTNVEESAENGVSYVYLQETQVATRSEEKNAESTVIPQNTQEKNTQNSFSEEVQTSNIIEKNEERIYFDEIPIESGKYYRVTGMSEINTIQETSKLSISDKTYYDRHILSIIAKHSTYTLEQLEEINQKDTDKIRALYKEFVVPTKTEAGEVTIRARRKSNHGDIGFSKEGLFYNVFDKESGHFGAPVIVGSEDMSLFQKGFHGNKHNVFNKEIASKTAVVLRDGFEASNFEYRLYEEGKGWYKNKFVDQKKNTYEEMSQNNKSSGDTSDSSSKNHFNFSQEVQENGLSKINYIGDVSGEVVQPEVDGKDVATKIQNLHYLAFENKNIFLTTLQSFSEKSGATIEGLDNMIKKTERMEEKVNKEYGGGIDSVKKLGDVLRSTLVFETTTDLNNNFPLLKKLIRENNIDLIRIKNRLGEPTTGDVLINVRFPNGLVAEIKLYTRLMYIAQDIPRVLPPDSKIPLTSYREGMVLDYASLWTDREIQCVQKLKDEGRVKYTLSNDITQPITNHQFYEIWRLLPDIKQNDENSIAFDLLKNKLIAIQQVNGWYSWQLYEKEHGEPYIQ